jgi:peptide/nickel transport system substrate-binding protein
MNRRLVSIVPLAVVVGLLAGAACGGGDEPEAAATQAPAAAAAPTKAPAVAATKAPAAAATKAPAAAATKAPAAAAAVPKRGGTVVINTGTNKPPTFDPLLDGRSGLMNAGPGLAYGSLMRSKGGPEFPPGGFAVVCEVCESWEQPDPVTFIFHLEEGITFAKSIGSEMSDFAGVNGREMDADDVVFSLNGMKDPKGSNRHRVADVVSVEAVDKYTVKVVLEAPNADFLEGIATIPGVPIVAHEIAEALGDFKQGPTVTTGPWIFESGDRTSGFKYVANPDYHILGFDGKPLPYFDSLIQVPFADRTAQTAAFLSGKLQWLSLRKPDYDTVSAQHPDWTYEFQKRRGSSGVLHVNKNVAPFKNNIDLRKAIFYAYNPYELIEVANNGLGYFFGGNYMPVGWAEELEPQMRQYVGDLDKAKEHLAASGVSTPLNLELWVANYGAAYVSGAEVIQDQLAKIGINSTLAIHEAAAYQASHNRGEWDFQIAYGPNGNSSINTWLGLHARSTGLRAKATGINDPELDRMIDEQWAMTDPAERKALNFKIAHYMASNAIWDPATTGITITGIRPEIHDLYITQVGYESRYLIDAWMD